MLIDSTLMLSDKQAVTASATSENIIDQTAAGDAHRHAAVVAQADEDFAGLTSLKISLQTCADSAFASPVELAAATFALADLKAGNALLKMALPSGALRYIRGYYTVSGTGTAGKISLFITDEPGQ